MARSFLIAAFVWLVSISPAVRGELTRPADTAELAVPSTFAPDIQFASSAADPEARTPASHGDSLSTAFSFVDPASAETASLDGADPTTPTRQFHPVCDCNCRIGSLDHWCVYDVHCGTSAGCSCHPCECSHGNCYLSEDGTWQCNDTYCDVWGPPVYRPDTAVRFGWWGVSTDGSEHKTGEFQDLDSSPFWDVDLISSDGVRTWDISLSGLDNEANDARVFYYGRGWSAKFDFQRYLRRWDHDPLAGYDLNGPVAPGNDDNVVTQDLNVGEDYAIRVEELNSKFKGRLTDNLTWRLNLWGQRKFGERQASAVAHCFDIIPAAGGGANQNNTCHVLSQRQTIDWLTMEIQPVVEAKFEDVTVEYSRTMRSFGQDDGAVSRQYTRFNNFSPANDVLGDDYNYSIVPENYTQIDRLKVLAQLTESNQFYANLYVGDTKNEFRQTHRDFNGFDLRLMNSSIDQVTLTGYASRYEEENELPTSYLTTPPYAPANTWDQDSLRHPVDYTRTRAGIKGAWQPFGDRGPRRTNYGLWEGTSLASGYEYYQLERDFATYNTTPVPPGPFSQPDTITHQIEFGPSTRWSRYLDTYTRYKVRFVDVPLIGVSEYSDEEPDVQAVFNSNLPEQVHSVDIGGSWTPFDNFMTTAQFTIQNSWHNSQYADFSENNYPFVLTTWYAPTQRWSFTTGYAYYSNWIDQDITLGANRGDATETERTRWNYWGENHLFNVGVNYAWSECVQLVGGYEWDRGTNAFNVPLSTHAADAVDWTPIESLADVIVETQRWTAGLDWQPYRDMNVYLHYTYFNYEDISAGLYSGTAHMALAGATRTW